MAKLGGVGNHDHSADTHLVKAEVAHVVDERAGEPAAPMVRSILDRLEAGKSSIGRE